MARRLNNKQASFCIEYLVDRNATQAAIRAGYGERTAGAQGHALLKNPEIQAAIADQEDARAKRTLITQDSILRGIRQIAEHGENEANRLRAMELLGKHQALFTERVESRNVNENHIHLPKMTDDEITDELARLRASAERAGMDSAPGAAAPVGADDAAELH